MLLTSNALPELSCEVTVDAASGMHTAQLKYENYEQGELTGPDVASIESQLDTIADYVRNGAIVRFGIILTEYFNKKSSGEVLDMDGVLLGKWICDELEWFHFIEENSTEHKLTAHTLWLLHDAIAKWSGFENN